MEILTEFGKRIRRSKSLIDRAAKRSISETSDSSQSTSTTADRNEELPDLEQEEPNSKLSKDEIGW